MIWTAPAARSGDGAFICFNCALVDPASEKRCRRFALPPQSKKFGGTNLVMVCVGFQTSSTDRAALLERDAKDAAGLV